MTNKPVIFYYSGTHWDREWYRTYQGFRFHLTAAMDDLIGYFETHPEAGPFHLDGQTIVLDDYLDIRPGMRPRLVKLLKSGRILAGPWYCAPDEHLISGESLIRNLQKGFKTCAQMQIKPWHVSNMCDAFGHISQMPQILNGFGIDAVIVGRGTNEHSAPAAFYWESPDSSRVLALRPPDKSGYGSFSMDVCGQTRKGTLKQEIDEGFCTNAKAYVEYEFSRANGRFAVLWDAMDHEPLHHEIPQYKKALEELFPDVEIRQNDLYQTFVWIREHCPSLPVWRGEMLEFAKQKGAYLHLLIHKLSSRQSIKAAYDQCEDRLVETVEPLCAWMKRLGLRDNVPFLDLAWEYLLKNSIHDTICGCSVDRVHNDTLYRFAQIHEICDVIVQDYQNTISDGHFMLSAPEEYFVVINPWPMQREGVYELTLPFAPEYPAWYEPFGYEGIAAFTLSDEDGKEILYAIKGVRKGAQLRGMSESRQPVDFYEIYVPLAFNGQQARSLRVTASQRPVRSPAGIAHNDGTLENEWIVASVETDGMVTLYDKVTCREYRGLCALADDSEIGDGWNHVSSVNNTTVLGGEATVAIEHSSTLAGVVRVEKTLQVPASNQARSAHDSDTVPLVCVFTYSLMQGERQLHVNLTVKNTARDHRLRLRIPTGIMADQYVTDENYAFITRSTAVDLSTYNWKECDKPERPMRGIVYKRDKNGSGLAFVSKQGLHECACVDDTLEITLLRCFADTYSDHPENGGQELFAHDYAFSIVPLDAGVKDISLLQLVQQMKASLTAFPAAQSIALGTMRVQGNVCVSSFGENFIRVYNPTDESEAFSLHSSLPFMKASVCDFLGNPLDDLNVEEHALHATVGPMKILMISFQTKGCGGE